MKFKNLSKKVNDQFNLMTESTLFKMDISKADLWDMYLNSFPEGTNEIYKERREYDCQCCAQFVKSIGNVVTINNGHIVTVWDIDIGGHFQVVVDAMAGLVRSAVISNIFLHTEPKFGQERTVQLLESGESINWDHFHCELPSNIVHQYNCAKKLGKHSTAQKVYRRGLTELSVESCEIVIDLINQKSLYKGDEFKESVEMFWGYKKAFDDIESENDRDIFVWGSLDNGAALIRNTVIGTLLQDISEGVSINDAVGSFEAKVAPVNYKRSSAPITKMMVTKAMDNIKSLGLEDSLVRRFAVIEDVSVNNVIFADRSASAVMKDGLVDSLMDEVKVNNKNYDSVDEVSIEDFVRDVIPNIDSMEVLVEGVHVNNMVSLIAPSIQDSKKLFKWDNHFSWSYMGNITDSIKERVKSAGGNVNGIMRVSLGWFNTDDLDIHIKEPDGNHIYYGSMNSHTSGNLDVDMNAQSLVKDPVENVVWTDYSRLPVGKYWVIINNYTQRNSSDGGFEVEIDFDGVSRVFTYPKVVKHKDNIHVLDIDYDGSSFDISNINNEVEVVGRSKEVWGIHTEKFEKVSVMMLSPNYWDEQKVGNKHYMFMIDDCVNPDNARGIYNEFLRGDLNEHRKVLEVLADKTKCGISESQLSGLGFSSTKRSSLVCKVSGNFTRTLKINF